MARMLSWVIALAACGSAAKPPADTASSGGCERGRCLDDISKTLQEHRAESRACYDAMAKTNPGAKGRLIINFKIDADGNVTETSQGMQEDQLTDETLVACVSDVIKRVKFAPSPAHKATRAYHQFEFSPR